MATEALPADGAGADRARLGRLGGGRRRVSVRLAPVPYARCTLSPGDVELHRILDLTTFRQILWRQRLTLLAEKGTKSTDLGAE